jgi:parvulin-like peptidyl-prolyl isomerase
MDWQHWQVSTERLEQLLRRTESIKLLLRRDIEEQVIAVVSLPDECRQALLHEHRSTHQLEDDQAMQAWLSQRGWDDQDLLLHVSRQECLNRFAAQHFGAGIEEDFLKRKNELDTVVYSLLRVQDQGMARELWIQLSEGETTFAEAAARYSDGPEATTKGVIGPVPLGQLQPELAERLRSLRQGELREPLAAGPWWILLRLEQLTPAKLDEPMRQRLLQEQLDRWLEQRCTAVLEGNSVDPLHYDPAP